MLGLGRGSGPQGQSGHRSCSSARTWLRLLIEPQPLPDLCEQAGHRASLRRFADPCKVRAPGAPACRAGPGRARTSARELPARDSRNACATPGFCSCGATPVQPQEARRPRQRPDRHTGSHGVARVDRVSVRRRANRHRRVLRVRCSAAEQRRPARLRRGRVALPRPRGSRRRDRLLVLAPRRDRRSP
jgi:hypothetical protein